MTDEAKLRNVTIFKTGKWNGVKVDTAMIDDMVEAFDALQTVHRVPFKFGHRPEDNIPKGQPAIGWVTALRRVGNEMKADFDHVPKMVKAAFEKKLYRTVSIEMLFGAKMGTRLFKHVLDAVALLGADQPAVHGLEDLDRFLAERGVLECDAGQRLSFETVAGINQPTTEVMKMEKEIEDRFARLEGLLGGIAKKFDSDEGIADKATRAKLRALEDENEDLKRKAKKDADDRAEFDRKQKVEQVKTKRAAVKAVFEAAVKARKILPADRDGLLDDDEAVLKVDETKLTAKFEVMKAQGKGGQAAHSIKTSTDQLPPDQEMVRLARTNMAETGEASFAVAFSRVAAANPELHREYLNMTQQEAI